MCPLLLNVDSLVLVGKFDKYRSSLFYIFMLTGVTYVEVILSETICVEWESCDCKETNIHWDELFSLQVLQECPKNQASEGVASHWWRRVLMYCSLPQTWQYFPSRFTFFLPCVPDLVAHHSPHHTWPPSPAMCEKREVSPVFWS